MRTQRRTRHRDRSGLAELPRRGHDAIRDGAPTRTGVGPTVHAAGSRLHLTVGGPFGLVATSEAVVRAPLDASGRDFLHRIWERECTRKSVTDRVSLACENEWRTVPHKDTLALAGTLNLTRMRGTDRVDVIGFEGSVLLDVDPGSRLVSLSPSDGTARQPVLLTSTGRCDPHARAESKQTFLFRVEVRVGDDPPVRVIVMPDGGMQVKALDLLDKVCG